MQAYLHADMVLKERALARTTPHDTPTGRYRPPDQLTWLDKGLTVVRSATG